MILIVDRHGLMASSLATALRHAGFSPVLSLEPDKLGPGISDASADVGAGDIVLLGLLSGDGRTTVGLIRPLIRWGCRVIVMSSDQGLALAGECLHRGAEAVLDMAMSFEHLVDVLHRLVAGDCAMTEEERAALAESIERHEVAEVALHRPFRALTEREAEVLTSLIAGIAPKQIAHCQGITISTVRGHIQRVLVKLDVRTEREALAMARQAGWP
jgi:two-component system, NarL family, nitrate/nitrite response regulator NarL